MSVIREGSEEGGGTVFGREWGGDADPIGSEIKGYSCFKVNKELHEHLDRLKIPHEYIEAPGVKHGYPGLFQKTGDRALDFYKKAFEKFGHVK